MPSYAYTSPKSTQINLKPGKYFFEAWGAQGGASKETSGKGGYASGYLQIKKETMVYIFVGGKGTFSSSSPSGGFNGGGAGFIGSLGHKCGGGGGSTDFRYDKNNLSTRFFVAGGGGGEGEYYGTVYSGGDGGGTAGTNGNCLSGRTFNGKYGTQSSGGTAVNYKTKVSGSGTSESGGIGTGWDNSGGGGGGGYFGGSGGYESGGGGGSGYISSEFTNPKLLAGDKEMVHLNGVYSQGNKGDGAARITMIISYWSTKRTKIKDVPFVFIIIFISKIES